MPTMMNLMRSLPLMALAWTPAASFSVGGHPSIVRTTPRTSTTSSPPIAMNMASIGSSEDYPAPAKMDEQLFKFNKIVIDTVYNIICLIYPVTGGDRDFARFFVLETVARVPYFAYLSVLHLRETFGERDLGDKMRTHYAEADNELHHLLIMESLGGNASPVDRVLAQTMAFFYYWYVVVVYAISEQAAYHLSELIEDHAFETYDKFLTEHADKLKSQPVPAIAHKYYVEDNPFLFDLFCTVKDKDEDGNFSARRPQLSTLYDVFVNVRDDEREHWKTLCNLVQYNDMQGIENKMVKSTEFVPKEPPATEVTAAAATTDSSTPFAATEAAAPQLSSSDTAKRNWPSVQTVDPTPSTKPSNK